MRLSFINVQIYVFYFLGLPPPEKDAKKAKKSAEIFVRKRKNLLLRIVFRDGGSFTTKEKWLLFHKRIRISLRIWYWVA